ncbi:MAG TPA: bifunctional metallophosphatase/5'-nucleotidase [Gemmatimonadaceae bacterium]|nr:bifunctional metallophosphatase/5'-nucleotidase [Gemmatimonadaceae bacterium]
MTISRRVLGALALGGVSLLACAHPPAGSGGAALPSTTLRFLLVNDVYVADTLRDGSGGVARVAALKRRLEGDGGGPVTFVLAGDVLSPSLLSKWYAGRQMVDAFNAAGLDYATFGNHEFELDRDTLAARVAQSRFRWISANCTLSTGAPLPGVRAWDTVTVRGVRVGLFGLTLRGDYRSYVRCADPDSAGHAAIAALRAAGAQLVVGLTHQSLGADSALLAREPALDLVLGGHEHEWHLVRMGGRSVAKADANARSAQLVTVVPGGPQEVRRYEMTRAMPLDEATTAVVRGWADTLLRRLGPDHVLATAPAAIDGHDAASHRNESPLGDIVTDAIRAGTGADVAIINSGTLRLDDWLGPGPITSYKLESIFLFADETRVVTFPITGARLRELLEHGVSERSYGHGGYPQLSGVRFTFDPSLPSGARIVGDVVLTASGRAVAPVDTLRLAFPIYPACAGGDGYVVPEAAAACAAREKAPRAADLVERYVGAAPGGQLAVPPAGRVVKLSR